MEECLQSSWIQAFHKAPNKLKVDGVVNPITQKYAIKPYMFLIDCHYYIPQKSFDDWNAFFPLTQWWIGGMNYIDHPIDTELWGGEAHLRVMNGKDGLMKVHYKPRANKAYSHDLNNVEIGESMSL